MKKTEKTKVEDEEEDEEIEEKQENEELERMIEAPVPQLDGEFTDKTSFVDRCKLMEEVEKNYIYKRVLRPARTEEPSRRVTINDAVLFHVNAFIAERYDSPFDSSYMRKKPVLSKLNRLMRGYAIALLMMKVGEMAEFAIHHDFAFGKLGCPPRVPERADLIVILEVVDVFSRGTVEYFHSLSIYDQDEDVTPEMVVKFAKDDLKLGNELFKANNFENAVYHFRRAIILLERNSSNSATADNLNQTLIVLYFNAAIAYIKLKNGPSTVNMARKALRIDFESVKGNFLLGIGYTLLSKLERAKLYLSKAHSKRPFDSEINAEIEKLDKLMAETLDEKAEMYEKLSKALVPFVLASNQPAEPQEKIGIQEMGLNLKVEAIEKKEEMWTVCGDIES